jgi:hypothetical protein
MTVLVRFVARTSGPNDTASAQAVLPVSRPWPSGKAYKGGAGRYGRGKTALCFDAFWILRLFQTPVVAADE